MATVSIANREALLFLSNLAPKEQPQKAFYESVSFGAEYVGLANLKLRYRNVYVVKGAQATRAALCNSLNSMTGATTVKAVDLVFVTHGLSGAVAFSDQTVNMNVVREDIKNALSSARRAKLRFLFSTACYGESHRSQWRDAGFKVAAGSRRIYADAALSYPAFLGPWALGRTFQTAINAANSVDPLKVNDNAAKQVLKKWNYPDWKDVDSHRMVSGDGSLKIDVI